MAHSRHSPPKRHHSDHSGAHAHGTAHHMSNASNPMDGQEPDSGSGAMPGGYSDQPTSIGGPSEGDGGEPGGSMPG